MSFTFTGIITENLWNNETINPPSGEPNPQTGFPQGSGETRTFNPFNQAITWNSDIPTNFQNLSINQIAQLDINYRFIINYVFAVKGLQGFQCSDAPNLNMNIYRPDNNLILTYNFETLNPPGGTRGGSSQYCKDTACPTFNTGEQFTKENFPTPEAYDIQLAPWNNGKCGNQSVVNLIFETVTNITLIVSCSTEEELDSQFCSSFCTFNQDNLKACYPAYREFCLVNTSDPANINIFTNTNCVEFFEDYISQVGTNATIDNDLENACTAKFPFPSIDTYDNANRTVRNICACHLPVEVYDNLQASLVAEFPGFQYVDENERCLFPTCASSNFLTQSIGKACRLPACINIASVTNDGTIKGGVNIKQSNECINASKQTGNKSLPGEAKSWIENNWIWIVLGIGILIVLIIIIIIISNSGKKKKKIIPKNFNENNEI